MRLRAWLVSMTLCSMSWHASAQGYQPDFDASRYKGPATGGATDVLVLGSPHLSQLPKTFQPSGLALLNERLAAWKPQAIAVESLSGPQCDFMRRYQARYKDSIEFYCWDPAPARAAIGLDVAAATEEYEKLLASWPDAPTAAQRRRLAALFLAGGERESALVQWLRLPADERRAGDGLDAALVALLRKLETRVSETELIAAALAARLGHERLYPMDDHTADYPVTDRQAVIAAFDKIWDNAANRSRRKADEVLHQDLGSAQGILALYRACNAPGQGALVFESDFGAAMNESSPQRLGRKYLGYWETRNLRMAGNIREAMTHRPGERVLVIVGASHKGYLETYLHQMHDMRIVDAAAVLR